jgi:hypothetical protein
MEIHFENLKLKELVCGENGHLDHPKTEYVDQLFSFD